MDSHIDDGLGPTGGSTPVKPTAIILEESSASGFFMQEDGSTASGAHGDNILLENKTGFGTSNKLELESDRIIVENYLNSGTIPFQNYINSTLQPITRPSDILISEYGALDLEDEAAEATNIRLESGVVSSGIVIMNGIDISSTLGGNPLRLETVNDKADGIQVNHGTGSLLLNGTDGSSTDAGGRFRFELATDDNININYPNV